MTTYSNLTTVNTFSKVTAIILLIVLPFVGFVIGVNYQKSITQVDTSGKIIKIKAETDKEGTMSPKLVVTTPKVSMTVTRTVTVPVTMTPGETTKMPKPSTEVTVAPTESTTQ